MPAIGDDQQKRSPLVQAQNSQRGRAETQHNSHTAPQSHCTLPHVCSATSPGEPHGPPREELRDEVVEVHPADLEASEQEGGPQVEPLPTDEAGPTGPARTGQEKCHKYANSMAH